MVRVLMMKNLTMTNLVHLTEEKRIHFRMMLKQKNSVDPFDK